jgi:hypothetical protein
MGRAGWPMVIILAAYALFMPRTGSPPIQSLALHQQIIALSSTPTMFWCLYRFYKRMPG